MRLPALREDRRERDRLVWCWACFLVRPQTHRHMHTHTNTQTHGHMNLLTHSMMSDVTQPRTFQDPNVVRDFQWPRQLNLLNRDCHNLNLKEWKFHSCSNLIILSCLQQNSPPNNHASENLVSSVNYFPKCTWWISPIPDRPPPNHPARPNKEKGDKSVFDAQGPASLWGPKTIHPSYPLPYSF